MFVFQIYGHIDVVFKVEVKPLKSSCRKDLEGEKQVWIHIQMPKINCIRCRKVLCYRKILGCRKVLVGKNEVWIHIQIYMYHISPSQACTTPANCCCFSVNLSILPSAVIFLLFSGAGISKTLGNQNYHCIYQQGSHNILEKKFQTHKTKFQTHF